jgi:hypothetical protein
VTGILHTACLLKREMKEYRKKTGKSEQKPEKSEFSGPDQVNSDSL